MGYISVSLPVVMFKTGWISGNKCLYTSQSVPILKLNAVNTVNLMQIGILIHLGCTLHTLHHVKCQKMCPTWHKETIQKSK